MKIRKAKKDDIEIIANNNVLLALESEEKFIDYSTVYNGVKSIIEDYNKGFFLVYERNNKIIGQLMITFEWSDWNDKYIWWIQSVYVDKSNRRIGVFNDLIKYIKKIAKNSKVKNLKLYVHKNNKNAKKVYEILGMSKIPYDIYKIDL
jgi:N-acetylglutamate synthase-like GNAT family acetyltransferase